MPIEPQRVQQSQPVPEQERTGEQQRRTAGLEYRGHSDIATTRRHAPTFRSRSG
jgi:hypothetical protein